MLKKIRFIVISVLVIELLIILSLITYNINNLKKENEEIRKEMKRIEILNKLYYEDIIQIYEK